MENDIVAVSLFSGAGGLDLASMMAGVPVISSTDIDADCIRTLKANEKYFGRTEILGGDLHQMDSEVFRQILNRTEYRKFLVIGGAPCQPVPEGRNHSFPGKILWGKAWIFRFRRICS